MLAPLKQPLLIAAALALSLVGDSALAGAVDIRYELTSSAFAGPPATGGMTLRFHQGTGTAVSTGPIEVVDLLLPIQFLIQNTTGGGVTGNGSPALVGRYGPPLGTNPHGSFFADSGFTFVSGNFVTWFGAVIGRHLFSLHLRTRCFTAASGACGSQSIRSAVALGPWSIDLGGGASSFRFSTGLERNLRLQIQGQEIGRTAVPGPGTAWLLGVGTGTLLMGGGGWRRLRRRRCLASAAGSVR